MGRITADGQSSLTSGPGKSKLRYPLRSAIKSKEDHSAETPASTKSISETNSSTKYRFNRKLQIPDKSTHSNAPISQTLNSALTTTPLSYVSRASTRNKFYVLPSASYWLSQIKLSESEGKHSISFGFFSLALDAGCKAYERICDELKSYAARHELVEDYQFINLLEKYNTKGAELTVQMPENDEVRSSCSSIKNPRPGKKPVVPRLSKHNGISKCVKEADQKSLKAVPCLPKNKKKVRYIKESESAVEEDKENKKVESEIFGESKEI